MSIIVLLLDTSGVEIAVDKDLDPNRELKAAGIGNILNGLGTGVLAIQAAADTAFVNKLGGNRFIMILAYCAFVSAIIVIGPGLIAYVPTLLLGGLLIFIGIDFLMTWVWATRKKLPLKDYAVVLCILLVVSLFGILEGVVVGIILAVLLFVHSYSQLSVIKSSLSGSEHVSNTDRDVEQTRYLDERSSKIQIIVLQGFLFFGTASRLLEDIQALLEDPNRSEIHYLVLDFHRVVEMDTSAANSFAKLLQLCKKKNISLNLTSCSDEIAKRFELLSEANNTAEQPLLNMFKSLDDGVTWCGDNILEGFSGDRENKDAETLLFQLLENENASRVISTYFKEVSFAKGHELFAQGQKGKIPVYYSKWVYCDQS